MGDGAKLTCLFVFLPTAPAPLLSAEATVPPAASGGTEKYSRGHSPPLPSAVWMLLPALGLALALGTLGGMSALAAARAPRTCRSW